MSDQDLERCYRLLKLDPQASLADLEMAYRQLTYHHTRGGSKEKLQQIKAAYQQLKTHLESQPPPSPVAAQSTLPPAGSEPTPERATAPMPPLSSQVLRQVRLGNTQPLETFLNQQLQARGWRVQVRMNGDHLELRLSAARPPQAVTATAVIYTLLKQLDLPHLQAVDLTAVQAAQRIWTRRLQLAREQGPFNRFSFENPLINGLAYPVALIAAVVINASPLLFFFQPLQIWVHEFGHATVAWLCGRRALPLPFGWTSWIPERTWWVYVGIVFLLGVLVWNSWRERLRWPIFLAGVIAVIQFYMTWMMSQWQFEMWVSFGGIGGEFYLSTLLMICFYFKFPDRWRWDFWRFVVLIVAAATFFDSFWLWHHIDRGLAEIPWGSIFGGAGDSNGDMNRLNGEFGWSVAQIVDTYSSLGKICLLTLIGTYGVFLVKLNPEIWYGIRQKTIVWLSGSR